MPKMVQLQYFFCFFDGWLPRIRYSVLVKISYLKVTLLFQQPILHLLNLFEKQRRTNS